MVPAYAASLLKQGGYEVFWDDGIAEGLTYAAWLERLVKQAPRLIALETKTPVVKRHWKIIDEVKLRLPDARVILMGDHVAALPLESFRESRVDVVIASGDYDFALREITDVFSGRKKHVTDGGIYLRARGEEFDASNLKVLLGEGGEIVFHTGPADLRQHDLKALPPIDRELSRWQLYALKNGNFKHLPGTYTMAGRDCWWGRCDFCSWASLYPGRTYRTFPVRRQLDELGMLIERYRVKEVFDDSGCFPGGEWLEEFCRGVVDRGYHQKVMLGCNMRVGALTADQFMLMKKANFRFILLGLESVNQHTLDRLTKGIRVEQIEQTCRMAKKAGLEPHITAMVGYPWESRHDAEETINLARNLFKKGYIDSLQATIVVPYPGTPMFEEALAKGWLLTLDWDEYDMKRSVWKSPVDSADVMRLTRGLYRAALHPIFIIRKILSIRDLDDLRFYLRAARKLFAHLTDFS
jgi:radical SAM superfamily enzyme YgiQ (UPF0313 family)